MMLYACSAMIIISLACQAVCDSMITYARARTCCSVRLLARGTVLMEASQEVTIQECRGWSETVGVFTHYGLICVMRGNKLA